MNINWKLRFQNKTTLCAIIAQIAAIVYAALGFAGIVPAITESAIVAFAYMIVELMCMIGIVTDPTTEGMSDSSRALEYESPAANINSK